MLKRKATSADQLQAPESKFPRTLPKKRPIRRCTQCVRSHTKCDKDTSPTGKCTTCTKRLFPVDCFIDPDDSSSSSALSSPITSSSAESPTPRSLSESSNTSSFSLDFSPLPVNFEASSTPATGGEIEYMFKVNTSNDTSPYPSATSTRGRTAHGGLQHTEPPNDTATFDFNAWINDSSCAPPTTATQTSPMVVDATQDAEPTNDSSSFNFDDCFNGSSCAPATAPAPASPMICDAMQHAGPAIDSPSYNFDDFFKGASSTAASTNAHATMASKDVDSTHNSSSFSFDDFYKESSHTPASTKADSAMAAQHAGPSKDFSAFDFDDLFSQFTTFAAPASTQTHAPDASQHAGSPEIIGGGSCATDHRNHLGLCASNQDHSHQLTAPKQLEDNGAAAQAEPKQSLQWNASGFSVDMSSTASGTGSSNGTIDTATASSASPSDEQHVGFGNFDGSHASFFDHEWTPPPNFWDIAPAGAAGFENRLERPQTSFESTAPATHSDPASANPERSDPKFEDQNPSDASSSKPEWAAAAIYCDHATLHVTKIDIDRPYGQNDSTPHLTTNVPATITYNEYGRIVSAVFGMPPARWAGAG